MTPINHPSWIPLRESLGSFPHSLLIAPASQTALKRRVGLLAQDAAEAMARPGAAGITLLSRLI